jgi:hypothetical protein
MYGVSLTPGVGVSEPLPHLDVAVAGLGILRHQSNQHRLVRIPPHRPVNRLQDADVLRLVADVSVGVYHDKSIVRAVDAKVSERVTDGARRVTATGLDEQVALRQSRQLLADPLGE